MQDMTHRHQMIRRALLPATSVAALVLLPLMAAAQEDLNPSDLVPRHFGQDRFAGLSLAQVYDINIALKRGRTIQIEGCTVSQTRQVVAAALQRGGPDKGMIQTTCG